MRLDQGEIETFLAERLAIPLRVSVAAAAIEENALNPDERRRYEQLATPQRREIWLRGRSALKALLRELGKSPDTAAVAFPNPCCSLTHSGGYAVAVGAMSPILEGIGVDLELRQAPRREAARFFLTEGEQAWIQGLGALRQRSALRRLWTIKEAAFKSDPENRGRMLVDYEIHTPGAKCGLAAVGRREVGAPIRYASLEFEEGALSLAVMCKEMRSP